LSIGFKNGQGNIFLECFVMEPVQPTDRYTQDFERTYCFYLMKLYRENHNTEYTKIKLAKQTMQL